MGNTLSHKIAIYHITISDHFLPLFFSSKLSTINTGKDVNVKVISEIYLPNEESTKGSTKRLPVSQ